MERALIVTQYYHLRDYLNRANKISNQKTEMKFSIEQMALFEYRLFVISQGPHESHKLALAERNRTKTWERTGNTRFILLEEYCALVLNRYEDLQKPFQRQLKLSDTLIQKLEIEIENKLKMLLLNKSYEP